jgi:acetyl esterase/lipase
VPHRATNERRAPVGSEDDPVTDLPNPAHRRRGGRLLATGLLLAGAAVAAGTVLRRSRRDLLAPVADELRSPVLLAPTDVANERTLAVARRLLARSTPVTAGVEVRIVEVAGSSGPPVPVTVYEPRGRVRPSGALLWIHGGGLVMGAPPQSHAWCSRVAAELGVLVVSVDYRLAPEDPFPAGLDDCMTALGWLAASASELGIDGARIAVGGESAGGGLAAAVAQRARDEGGPALCLQLLVYPMLDDRTVLRAARTGERSLIWSPASNRFGWTAYLGRAPGDGPAPPYAAPARTEDLHGLPPAWIGVGDIDLFHEEDVTYARRLADAGVPCELVVEPGMYHGADALLPKRPSMVRFRGRMVDALADAMAVDEGTG